MATTALSPLHLRLRAPSILLLRALRNPLLCTRCFSETSNLSNNKRFRKGYKSEWMPREKYAKVTSLDKLHRRQRAELRQEREDSRLRAASMPPPSWLSRLAPAATPSPTETTASSTSTTEAPTPSSPEISPASPSSIEPLPSKPALPYAHQRAGPAKNLPVYESAKSGGTRHLTTIRKLSGDLSAMQTHLCEALGIAPSIKDQRGRRRDNVAINWNTRHIIVRGWRAPEVKRWMEMVGL